VLPELPSREEALEPHTIACSPCLVRIYRWCTRPYKSSADASTIETSGIFALSSSSQKIKLVNDPYGALDTTANLPGSTSKTMSIASFQNGTIEFNPVRLKSSSMKSSATSQKYSCPGREQNQEIHVSVDVGVDDAERPREERVEVDIDGASWTNPRRDNRSENEISGQLLALRYDRVKETIRTVALLFLNLFHTLGIVGCSV